MISDFRLKHGEGVSPWINSHRIALEQPSDAAKISSTRVSILQFADPPARGRCGKHCVCYDVSRKPSSMIDSSGHRKKSSAPQALASASPAKSATSHRTYWAMVIAAIRPRQKLRQDNAACSQKKPVLNPAPQAPQSLLLSLDAVPRSALHRIGFLSADGGRGRRPVWISVNLTRPPRPCRDRTEREHLACASRSSIIRSRLSSAFKSSLISGSCFHIRTRTRPKTQSKAAEAGHCEDHGRCRHSRHLGVAGGERRRRRVCSRPVVPRSQRAVADLHAIGASALRFPPLPALNDCTK